MKGNDMAISKAEQNRRYRQTEGGRIAQRKYKRSELGIATQAKTGQRYDARHPQQKRAKNALNNAIRDGKIIKPDVCSCGCGSGDHIEGHHADYRKPLEVVWLAMKCHLLLRNASA